jgi:hypothetical protein
MTVKRILIAVVVLALLGAGAAYGWRAMQGLSNPDAVCVEARHRCSPRSVIAFFQLLAHAVTAF